MNTIYCVDYLGYNYSPEDCYYFKTERDAIKFVDYMCKDLVEDSSSFAIHTINLCTFDELKKELEE